MIIGCCAWRMAEGCSCTATAQHTLSSVPGPCCDYHLSPLEKYVHKSLRCSAAKESDFSCYP
jgi:hypothetical protein